VVRIQLHAPASFTHQPGHRRVSSSDQPAEVRNGDQLQRHSVRARLITSNDGDRHLTAEHLASPPATRTDHLDAAGDPIDHQRRHTIRHSLTLSVLSVLRCNSSGRVGAVAAGADTTLSVASSGLDGPAGDVVKCDRPLCGHVSSVPSSKLMNASAR
jgi:hypothetical protein